MSDQCELLLARLEKYLDGECPEDIEETVAEHLAECPPCLNRADFERKVRKLVSTHCSETAPQRLVESIRSRLNLSKP